MANVFEGNPDERQSTSITETLSRFRPKYRALTDDEKALHDEIKQKAVELEALFEKVNMTKPVKGRYYSLAITQLELAVMWIIKELTA